MLLLAEFTTRSYPVELDDRISFLRSAQLKLICIVLCAKSNKLCYSKFIRPLSNSGKTEVGMY